MMEFSLDHNLRFKDNVGKYVKVKTIDSHEHKGWLKCIDPLSGNVFLVSFNDCFTSVNRITLIMGEACSTLEVLREADEKVKGFLENLIHNDTESYEDVTDKKNRLILWIKQNRLPVFENEDQSLIVGGNVTILPPYDIESCRSLNGRTLKGIRQLVAKLPSNIVDKEVSKETDK